VDARGHLIDPDEAFAQVLDPSGRIVDSSSGVSAGPILSAAQLQGLTRPAFFTRRVEGVDDPVRLLAVPGTLAGRPDVVVVGSTLGDRNEALIRLLLLLAVIGPIALVLVSLAGWLLAGAALRPVERMRREAAAISASEPDRRLPVPGTDDELARLGTTLNSMLDRLQESNERERRFVDDASHELRTPLSVLKMELDLALSRSRSIEELEASLSNASRETDRLVRLAQDLLVLARLEGGRVPVRRVEVPVGGLIREACAAQEDRARAIGVRIVAAADDGTARLDPVRVRQAIDNLIDNALRQAPEGSEIDVQAQEKDGSLILQLHSFEIEHDHGRIGNRNQQPADAPGNAERYIFKYAQRRACLIVVHASAERPCTRIADC
jgi:signal transduction histidine kinase